MKHKKSKLSNQCIIYENLYTKPTEMPQNVINLQRDTNQITLMKRIFIIAICALLGCIQTSFGQMARLYTSESGLYNSRINEIHQDRKGFIWITSENGMMRFDGMNFSAFRLDRSNPNSIASDLVLTLFDDSMGTYWVGTSSGLQTFNPEYNSFIKIDLKDPEVELSDPHISAICECVIRGERKILAASSGHGFYVIDPVSHKPDSKTRDKLNGILHSRFLNNIYCDTHQRLWVSGENGGLTVIDLNTIDLAEDIKISDALKDKIIVNSFTDRVNSDDIYIGTSRHGILIYDSETGTIRQSRDKSASSCRVESMLVNNICPPRDRRETYLVGVENEGIKVFDAERESLSDLVIPNIPVDISSWKPHSMIEDNQGNVWIGAFQTGVMVIPKSMHGFEYNSLHGKPGGIGNAPCVTSIISDPKGNLWVGTDGSGIFNIAPDGTLKKYSSENSSLSNNSIMALAIDKRGTLWIATYLEGLFSWRADTGFREFKGSEELKTEKISCLTYSEKDDILYVGTHGQGMAVVSLPNERVSYRFADDDNKWISSLYIDNSGIVWVGTYNGPMCYDHRANSLISYNTGEHQSNRVSSFCESSDGKIWIGSGEGLISLDRQTGKIKAYTEEDGLSSNVTASILEGEDGHIWIATLNGLSRFNPQTEIFKNYYHHDGLQENEFHSRAAFKSDNGKMYFGGIKGLTSFFPSVVDQRSHPVPPLYFSDLRVMNKAIEYDPEAGKDNILDRHITEATEITLPFSSKIFSIKFSVLEYTNPEKIQYAYMMEGFDKNWNLAGADSRVVTYTNLPVGKYTMKVKAYFEGENNNYSYKEIEIRILPPWYRSTYAFICYLLLSLLLVVGLLEYRKKLNIRRKEKEESEIKELKLRMFTNISHEIRTPLTLVMNPLKKMREAESDSSRKALYNLMYRNCLRINRLVNQLLDMRKIDNGQMQLHFLETDIVYFIRDIMQSFENLAVTKNISFHISAVEQVTNLWIDQGNFDKIVFNILSNAFKYTPDNGKINIRISGPLANEGSLEMGVKKYIEITIENSGSMVEEKHLDRLFDRFFQVDIRDAKMGSGVGLNLSKMLVELHHGSIRAYNTSEGMAFAIQLPVGNSHLSEVEMTKPTNHKDLYTKHPGISEDHLDSREDMTYNPENNDSTLSKSVKSKKHIVLVDDDSEMRAYLKLELKGLYNVTTCANAKDAWNEISRSIPDAVVTDLIMEGMNGAELCSKIRKNPETNHIPVIILTSSSDEQNIQDCIESGADRFFTKPISLEILKGAISHAITTRDTIRNKYSSDIDYGYADIHMTDINDKLTERVVNIIKANIENTEFGVEELSREVGMSRVHLNRKLKELMNISPSNLIRSIRLKQAAYLLINNKVNISEVAYRVGFSTHSYFSNSFHDYFGMTPKDFVSRYMGCKDEETLKKIFG